MQVTTIGLDLAKNIFQIHGVDADGNVVVRKKLGRAGLLAFFSKLPSCIVGHRSLCDGALLGSRTDSDWPSCKADATSICEALRQARQE